MVVKEYSKEEKLACIEEYKESGMSITEFSRLRGIPDSTFRGWLKLDRALAFGEIEVKPQSQQVIAPIAVKKTMVFAKDDIRIELKEGFDKEFLKKIVEVMINAN